MSKLDEMLANQQKKKKRYKNSECESCEDHTVEVRLLNGEIICEKCFKARIDK